MQAGRAQGMHTMDQHLAELVKAGTISYESAVEKAHDSDGLDRLMQRTDSPIQASVRTSQAGPIDFGDSFSKAVR
jgi:twitching motility protein PilT